MAKQPTPMIEVVIRDEVTAGLERAKRRTQQETARDWFGGLEQSFARIGGGAQLLRREFGTLLGVTGIGAFLGGGLVAGIAKVTESLSGLAREAQQTKYTAEALGISVETMNRLTVRGMTLGQSQQEAQQSIKGLTEGLLNMQTYGRKSSEWQALLKGKGGERLGRALEAAFKRGGPEEAARLLAQQMGPMALSGQKALRDTFHLGLGFQDLFKVDQRDLAEIYELSEPEARKYAIAMTKLNIEFANVTKTLAVAVMPMFERMATGLSNFLQGPGGKMVKDFGQWLKGIDIDWDAIAKAVTKILDALVSFFGSISKILQEMNPIIQQMGGWKTVIGGLAIVLGTAGLAGWLGPVGVALGTIGAAAWVVPMLTSTANAATAETGPSEGAGKGKRLDRPGATPPGSTGTSAPGGGSGGTASPMELPAIQVKPPRSRRPERQSQNDPENAAPYRVAGGWQPPPRVQSNTEELRSEVRALKTEVAALGGFISNMPLTDESGAGSIAGFSGVLRRLSSPMGGGGGARRRGGGGGGVRPDRGGIPEGGTGRAMSRADVEALAEKHVSASGLVGFVPADGARYGIKTGSKEEWVHYFSWLAYKESGFNPRSTNTKDPGGSYGIMQVSPLDVGRHKLGGPGGSVRELYDPDTNIGVGVRLTEKLIREGGGYIRGGRPGAWQGAARSWSPLRREAPPPRDATAAPATTSPRPSVTQSPQQPRGDAEGPGFRTERNIEVEKYVGFQRAITGLHPEFQARLMAAYNAMPPEIRKSFVINEGWRSYEYQKFLKDTQRSLHRGMVARPGRSRHEGGGEFGEGGAVDIDAGPAREWLRRNGRRFGINDLRGDAPHFEFTRKDARQFDDPQNPQRLPVPGAKPEPESSDDEASNRQILFTRARQRNMGLTIRVRGPRGVKVSSESSGAVSPATIERSMDATGGGQIESPA